MRFHALLPITELFDGFQQAFDIADQRVLLVQEAGVVYAIEDKCGHFGVSLAKGVVCAGAIRCGVHGVEFDLATGWVRRDTVGQCNPVRCYTVAGPYGQTGRIEIMMVIMIMSSNIKISILLLLY